MWVIVYIDSQRAGSACVIMSRPLFFARTSRLKLQPRLRQNHARAPYTVLFCVARCCTILSTATSTVHVRAPAPSRHWAPKARKVNASILGLLFRSSQYEFVPPSHSYRCSKVIDRCLQWNADKNILALVKLGYVARPRRGGGPGGGGGTL